MTAYKPILSRPAIARCPFFMLILMVLAVTSCTYAPNAGSLATLENQITLEWIYTPSATPTFTPFPTLTPIPTITLTPTLAPTATPIYPPMDDFVGTWRNIDPYTKSWPKIKIKILLDNILSVQFTGFCIPYLSSVWCDGGPNSEAVYKGNPVILFTYPACEPMIIGPDKTASIVYPGGTMDSTLTVDGDTLHVITLTHYSISSKMKDKIIKDDYKK